MPTLFFRLPGHIIPNRHGAKLTTQAIGLDKSHYITGVAGYGGAGVLFVGSDEVAAFVEGVGLGFFDGVGVFV